MNIGMKRCPYGSGAHPYLTLGTPAVDRLILRVPARTVLRPDERGLPTGPEAVEDTGYDFRKPRRIGSTTLDHAFTDLKRDEDGVARVEFRDPDDGTRVWLFGDESYPYLMLFSGRPASRRSPPQPCRRAHDVPAECISDPGRSDRARARFVVHEHLGHCSRTPSGAS
jgi:aldose 1-epimerase